MERAAGADRRTLGVAENRRRHRHPPPAGIRLTIQRYVCAADREGSSGYGFLALSRVAASASTAGSERFETNSGSVLLEWSSGRADLGRHGFC